VSLNASCSFVALSPGSFCYNPPKSTSRANQRFSSCVIGTHQSSGWSFLFAGSLCSQLYQSTIQLFLPVIYWHRVGAAAVLEFTSMAAHVAGNMTLKFKFELKE